MTFSRLEAAVYVGFESQDNFLVLIKRQSQRVMLQSDDANGRCPEFLVVTAKERYL